MKQPYGAVDRDLAFEEPPRLPVAPESRVRRGRLGAVEVLLEHGLTAFEDGLLVGGKAPFGEVRGGCDPDQPRHFRAQFQGQQQHQPPAHRRADQDDRAVHSLLDQAGHLFLPAAQRPVGKFAGALAAARVVEQEAGSTMRFGPFGQRRRLAAEHVRHVARQENQRRPAACTMPEGDTAPVGHLVELRLAHPAQMAMRCREGKRQRRAAWRVISSSSWASSSSAD